ncbi:MAG TPA: GNAT family N-acetyltransferase [Myxococcales bacterium]|nr:GNAT family N-acetyltransferase [Myxococcales bacterium]
MQDLDRPVWASLTTFHAPMAEGDERARRFVPDVNLFASARDAAADAQQGLAALVRPGECVYILQVPPIAIPSGLRAAKMAAGVQMVAKRPLHAERDDEIELLTDADAPEMLALATLTQPGPFLSRTHRMGRFLGIRREGRLAAMAGERMRFPGHTEVSGVCTHPDFRGQGLARRLSVAVTAAIQGRGDQPFLHAWATNTAAITLYGELGFELRAGVNVAVLERERGPERGP